MQHHLFHIVAASGDVVAGQGIIGENNQLPWPKNSADLKFFKATTMGCTLIMGRKTFESIGGKPLPGRENFVLSHSQLNVPGVRVFSAVDEALKHAPTENVFIIGGADVYQQTIKRAEGIYLTRIEGSYSGDAKYPPIPKIFEENKERSKFLQERFKVPVVYLENTMIPGTHTFKRYVSPE